MRRPQGFRSVLVVPVVALLSQGAPALAEDALPPSKITLPAPKTGLPDLFPLDQVKPGLKGIGYTVLQGDSIEPFGVEILGVMKNAISPKRDIIFVKLEGANVEDTGVAAGMSGSPVYVDGKLLGALSYRFGSFSKEPLGGVTPISYMLAIDGGPQSAPTPGGVPGGIPLSDSTTATAAPGNPMAPASWNQAFRQFVTMRHAAPFDPALGLKRLTGASAPAVSETMQRIATPLSISGCSPRVWQAASSLFGTLGFEPVAGAAVMAGAAGGGGAGAKLEGGSAVGVQLIRGDMDMTATGTVTLVDGDRLYAFGHQFFNFGRVSLPMTHASIIRTLVSAAGSFKVASAGDVAGSFSQDRTAGIFGHVGPQAKANMVPVNVTFTDGAGAPITYTYEIAADPVLAPVLLNYSLQNVFSAADKEFGEKTLVVDGAIKVDGQPDVAVQNFFSGQASYNFASSYVAAFLNFLYANQFELPKVSSLDLKIKASDDVKIAEVGNVVSSAYEVAPGDTIHLKVALHPRRGSETLVSCDLEVPEDAPVGNATIYVGDAETLGKLEAGGGPTEPQSMGDVISLLNGIRRDNCLYASLSSQEPGLIIGGQEMAALPGSSLALLNVDQGARKASVQRASLYEKELETEHTISGSREIKIRIVPRKS